MFLCSIENITLFISTVKRWVLIFCEEFVKSWFYGFTGDSHLLSHSIFLILHHFYTISFDFGVTLIFFTPNYTIDLHLHHSRYSFRQIHFWHLISYMSHFSDMIVDIHSDLRIRMVFAPLRSVLNGCPPDIQHPITYCITFGLTLFSPNLVHPVWRRMCADIWGISSGSLFSFSANIVSLLL